MERVDRVLMFGVFDFSFFNAYIIILKYFSVQDQ